MPEYPQKSIGASLYRSARGQYHQVLVLVTSFAAIIIGLALPPLSLEAQLWIVILPIGLFGLSHGGADPWILQHFSIPRWVGLIGYLLAAAVFVIVVTYSPLIALSVFLALSVWHFGFTDEAYVSDKRNYLLLSLSGSAPIIGPMIGHPDQTSQLFAWLLLRDTEPVLTVISRLGPALAFLWLTGFVFLAFRPDSHAYIVARAELFLIALAVTLLPPLLSFAFYFCLIHSVRHFISVNDNRAKTQNTKEIARSMAALTLPATITALILGLMVWLLLTVWNPEPQFLADAVRVMFWGLAALTVPHSLLVHLWWHRVPAR